MLYPVYLWKDPLGPGQKAREEHVAHHQRHHIGQQLSLHIHLAGRRPERSVTLWWTNIAMENGHL